jgi:hypothetical protein
VRKIAEEMAVSPTTVQKLSALAKAAGESGTWLLELYGRMIV